MTRSGMGGGDGKIIAEKDWKDGEGGGGGRGCDGAGGDVGRDGEREEKREGVSAGLRVEGADCSGGHLAGLRRADE